MFINVIKMYVSNLTMNQTKSKQSAVYLGTHVPNSINNRQQRMTSSWSTSSELVHYHSLSDPAFWIRKQD
jgi:hypothetical protein